TELISSKREPFSDAPITRRACGGRSTNALRATRRRLRNLPRNKRKACRGRQAPRTSGEPGNGSMPGPYGLLGGLPQADRIVFDNVDHCDVDDMLHAAGC